MVMGKIKLSNTKRGKYKECPKRYDFHYNYKYRTIAYGSPLFFGVSIDEALNRMLLDKKKNHTEEEKELMKLTPVETFIKYMTDVEYNKHSVHIPTFKDCVYSKADYDATMLSEEDLEDIGHDLDYCNAHVEWYHAEKKKKTPEISEEDTLSFNLMNWYSLRRKGLMILELYEKDIMPQIHEVFSIQERVNLPNGSGDSIDGVIDFVASFVDDPSTKYVVDNKTASKAYKDSDLNESDQLHLYAYYKEIENIAYIVCEKNIRKREPRVRINILKGTVDDDFTENLLDDYEEVLYNIREEKFNPDFKSGCFFFGKPCEYHSLCHHDKFDDNILVDLKKVKK